MNIKTSDFKDKEEFFQWVGKHGNDYYREYKDTPEFNFRLRAGIEFYIGNINLLFYGDAYVNNLIGFEPITFNQRTEHYFDKPYGELGLKFVLKF